MQRLLRPTVVLAALIMAGAMTIIPARSETPTPSPDLTPTPVAETASPTSTPSPAPETASPTPEPAPSPGWTPPAGYTGTLQPDMRVQITGTGSCLNARIQPGLKFTPEQGGQDVPVFNCLPDGFVGTITATARVAGTLSPPVLADGHWWWYMLGQGWLAEDWLTPAEEQKVPPASGIIAFARDGGVWLMNADGSEQRLIHSVDPAASSTNTLEWSPDGTKLAVGIESWTPTFFRVTRILGLDGAVLAEYPSLSHATWSPDGLLLAGLKVSVDPIGGSLYTPVVVNPANGAETAVGPASQSGGEGPVWSPDSLWVGYSCASSAWETLGADGLPVKTEILCDGGSGLRAAPAGGGPGWVILPSEPNGYYLQAAWSPTGGTIAVLTSGIGAPCRGYALVDISTSTVTQCLNIPDNGSLFFGCGGGPAVGPSAWSSDGRVFAYHSQSGFGKNGIVIVDTATGGEVHIPALYSTSVEFTADDTRLVFGADDQVWTAGVDGSGPVHMAQGRMPTWQPVR